MYVQVFEIRSKLHRQKWSSVSVWHQIRLDAVEIKAKKWLDYIKRFIFHEIFVKDVLLYFDWFFDRVRIKYFDIVLQWFEEIQLLQSRRSF